MGANSAVHSVLILGGGVGGVVAANRLRRLMPRGDRIIVVDRQPTASFGALNGFPPNFSASTVTSPFAS